MKNVPEHLVFITGLSGAGKSYVQSTLEDLGFYCADNLPVSLIDPFLDEVTARGRYSRIGVVVDIRTPDFAESFPPVFQRIRGEVPHALLMFLDAGDDVLARRFSETRRPHPYDPEVPVEEAIQAERQALTEVRSLANMVVDTSVFSVHELRAEIMKRFEIPGLGHQMLVSIISFGFKYPAPYNVDLLFDVRFLPNPHFVDHLRPKTGLDDEVVEYLRNQPEYVTFSEKLIDFLRYLVPQYEKEMKSYLTIGIGCTGGKHRSVAIAQWLADQLREDRYRVEVAHRDCRR